MFFGKASATSDFGARVYWAASMNRSRSDDSENALSMNSMAHNFASDLPSRNTVGSSRIARVGRGGRVLSRLISLCVLLLTFGLVLIGSVWGAATPAPVYLVIGSDTAIWNAGTTVDVNPRHPHYKQDSFTDPKSVSYKVMEPAFRNAFRDSFSNSLKLTWWMMAGNIYRDADNLNVPIANTMTLYLMKKYHGNAITQLGDELSLHYHTFFWSDYNGDGTNHWSQSRTFHECRDDFDFTVAQFLLDEDVFPVSFRSGWHFMDNEWQQELDELLPFSMHNASPRKSTDSTEPFGNVLD
jgi:hypothetical protein